MTLHRGLSRTLAGPNSGSARCARPCRTSAQEAALRYVTASDLLIGERSCRSPEYFSIITLTSRKQTDASLGGEGAVPAQSHLFTLKGGGRWVSVKRSLANHRSGDENSVEMFSNCCPACSYCRFKRSDIRGAAQIFFFSLPLQNTGVKFLLTYILLRTDSQNITPIGFRGWGGGLKVLVISQIGIFNKITI